MSILEGFAMLNNSIRQIRTNNLQHEERMQALDLEKKKLDAQQNDPRNRLAKIQAAKELELAPVNYKVGDFKSDNERTYFNRYTRPAVEKVLEDEGLSLNNDGGVVVAGTNKQARLPKFQQRTLANKIALATMGSRLGHTELDMQIDTLSEDIANMKQSKSKSGTAKDKIFESQLLRKEERLANLQNERTDPKKSLERLMSSNQTLGEMYSAALSDPNIDDTFYSRLNKARELNNDEIKNVLAANPEMGKNIVSVDYSMVGDDGSINKRSVYMNKMQVANAPRELDFGDGKYRLGTVSNVPKSGEGGGKLEGGLTPSQAQSIYTRHAKAQDIISAAKQKDMGEEHIKSILAQGGDMTPTEIDNMMKLIKTDAAQVIKHWERVAKQDEYLFGKYAWFNADNAPMKDTKKGGPALQGDFLNILGK